MGDATGEPDRRVTLEVAESVAHVVIDGPAKRNALTRRMLVELGAHASEISDRHDVRAVVISGRGGQFSSGLDVGDLAELVSSQLDASGIAQVQDILTAYEELDVPVLAAIDGVCLGAGLQLALACHVRAVTPSARLAVLEPRWGLVPDLGASWRLPRIVGVGRATALVLDERGIDAEEALRIGLADVQLDVEQGIDVRAAAHELARRWAAGPEVVRHLPRLVREGATLDRSAALAAEAHLQLRMLRGGDVEEAFRAAAEGRAPRFPSHRRPDDALEP
jgi:enoyl-CoA hydratase/carnithine racemase